MDLFRLEGKPPIKLIYVDRTEDARVFRQLDEAEDREVARLADVMSQVIVIGQERERLKVEARRFNPRNLTAVLKAPPESDAVRQAREIMQDANASAGMRAMAEEVLRKIQHSGTRLLINAENPIIRKLADFVDQAELRTESSEIVPVLLGVYNLSILSNAEMLTPRNREIFGASFRTLLESRLTHLEQRKDLDRQRRELQRQREAAAEATGPAPRHRVFFLMTPFQGYEELELALRTVIEDKWGCQLVLAPIAPTRPASSRTCAPT